MVKFSPIFLSASHHIFVLPIIILFAILAQNNIIMKRYFAIALTLCMVMTAVCQDIVGSWAGKLNFGSSTLNLVFNISKADTGYKTTIDSPDQMAKGIPTDNTTFNDSVLSIGIKMLGASFSGTCVENDKIRGAFTQSGISLPIELSRQKAEALIKSRPQEPKAPFPYKIEEIIFENESAGIKLAGTLTMPSKGTKFPAVILVTGSGAQNRNEEIMGHKPFLVIADYLTRNGIAVLRYDDRGTAKSEGNFANATTADFATDAHAALKYLTSRKDINLKKIGIIGHSEGASIAIMEAANNKDVAYIITLAGPGVSGKEIIEKQVETMMRNSGVTDLLIEKQMPTYKARYEILCQDKNIEQIRNEFIANIEKSIPTDNLNQPAVKKEIDASVKSMTSQWYINFLKYNPATDLSKIKCPMLALNGDKDVQVDAEINLSAIKNIVKSNLTIKKYPGLNHMFQHASETGNPLDYASIEETIAPIVLSDITTWILARR